MDLRDLYQEIILEHSRHPRHRGECACETHCARAENPTCGDEVAVHLRVSPSGVVEEVTFSGQGCALSQASASLLTVKVRGRSVVEALALGNEVATLLAGKEPEPGRLEDLGELAALQGASRYPQRVKCVTLAWHALEAALVGDGSAAAT